MNQQALLERDSLGAQVVHRGQRLLAKTARFARHKPLGFVGMMICLTAIFVSIFATPIGRYDPNFGGNYVDAFQGPSFTHWFGTDESGRDVFSRLAHGTGVSLQIAFYAIGIASVSGFLLGIVSGYFGGWVDMLLQRITDSLLAFPGILLALTLVAVLGGGLAAVAVAIGIAFAPSPLRIIRGTVLSVRENAYIDAARVIGASSLRIMFRHVLPNVMAPFLIIASVALGAAILIEAALSYLGLGVPPPYPSWGRSLSGSASDYAIVAPWLVIFPGLAISILVLGFNMFGDALRDIWDPRLRGR